jgi:hypothetical protein
MIPPLKSYLPPNHPILSLGLLDVLVGLTFIHIPLTNYPSNPSNVCFLNIVLTIKATSVSMCQLDVSIFLGM